MLSLGAGSSCDVCYETFGTDRKAPCSISCGHVFCLDCISNITHLCPLCRIPFDKDSVIKLHVDLDAIPIEQASGCTSADLQEAQRLQKAIANIADKGTTEQNLRQLIQEGRTFLHGQPRNLHKDLRVSHRMLAYLCDVKTELRAQKQGTEGLNEQMRQLATEKEELMAKLSEEIETRRYERETALAVETSLREHCAGAVNNYNVLIDQFNKLLASTAQLVRPPPIPSQSATSSSETSISDSIAPTPAFDLNLLPGIDLKALDGAAVRDSDSFLISPLPQFTSILPAVYDAFRPLPELTEDVEGEDEDEKTDDEEEIPTPDSSRSQRVIPNPLELKKSAFIQHSMESLSTLRPEVNRVSEPSSLSRTVPYIEQRRPRSSSSPTQPRSRPRSRSHSPFDHSTSTTPPMPPPQHLMSQSGRYAQVSREPYGSSTRNADGEVLRTRLHDILRDSPTSSSLPIMTSGHFPASFANRDREREREREAPTTNGVLPPPTRTSSSNGKSSTPIPPSSSDGISHLLASGPHQQILNKPISTPSPNPAGQGQRYSSASEEAKKLEEERRRKERQQREERHKEERYREERHKEDRYREDRPKDEKYREERYREDKQGVDYEKHPADTDRDYRSKVSSRTTNAVPSVAPNQAPRWDQPASNQSYVYSNPLSSTPTPNGSSVSSSSLKRGGSISGQSAGYGRPAAATPVPVQEPPSHGRYASNTSSSKPRSNAMSNQIPTNPAGIYT